MRLRLATASVVFLVACQSPGSGGRGGFFPVDAVGGDTLGADTTGTTGATDTSGTTGTVDPGDTSSDDTSVPPIDTHVGDDTVTAPCTEIPLSGTLDVMTSLGGGAWTSPQGMNLGLGGAAPDAAMLVFESSQTGAFSLAGQTPGTCVRCFQVAVDVGQGGTTYFANAGQVEVLVSPMSALDVVLSDVTFVEVSGNGNIVPGGGCLTIGEVRLQGTGEVCEPDCAGRVCGDNGCGGECGPGCQLGQTCTAAGTCSGGTATGCTTIAPTGALVGVQPGVYGIEVTNLSLGGAGQDFLQLEFYVEDTGTFNLGTPPNDDYATCNQCVRIFEDDDGAGGATVFYQSKGTLAVSASSQIAADPPTGSFTLTNVELVEVTIDPDSFESTPVSGGRCYTISNRTLSTP